MDKKLFYTLTSLLLVLMCTTASFTQENKGHLPKLLAISPNFQHISSQEVHDFWSKNYTQDRNTIPWESIGPTEVLSSEGIDFLVSGRVKYIDFVRDNLIRFVSASGGLFEARRAVGKWEIKNISEHQVTTTWGGASDTSPFDENIILYGTGDHIYRRGTGLWRTADGGTSWHPISTEATYFHDIVFSKTNTQVWASGNVVISSTDQGITWKTHMKGDFSSLVIDPMQPDTVYVSDFGKGIFRTFDGGNTWNKLSGGLPTEDFGRIELTICDYFPNVLYASYCNAKNGTKGVWKTIDYGETWTQCQILNSLYEPDAKIHLNAGDFHSMISVSPVNPDQVIVGGWWYVISNDGKTFIGPNSGSHVDYHYATWDDTGTRIFMATDGGVSYMNFDEITIFEDNAVKIKKDLMKVPTLQFVSVSASKGSKMLVGGTQDNGFVFYNSDVDTWYYHVGDGGDVSTHFMEDHLFHGTMGFSGEPLAFKNVGKVDKELNSFYDINNGIRPCDEWFRRVGTAFGEQLLLLTQTYNTLYLSTNFGFVWTPIDFDGFDAESINTIQPTTESNPKIFISGNGSPTTSAIKLDPTTMEHSYISDGLPIVKGISWPQVYVSPSPDMKHKVFAFMYSYSNNTRGAKVFVSDVENISWKNITGDLPDVPITTMFVHPQDENFILIGTDGFGVFVTENGGKSWSPYNANLPKGGLITDFDYQTVNDTLYVIMATYGNGLYKSPLPPALVSTKDTQIGAKNLRITYENGQAMIHLNDKITDNSSIKIYDINGRLLQVLDVFERLDYGLISVDIDLLPVGMYIVNLTDKVKQYAGKMVVVD